MAPDKRYRLIYKPAVFIASLIPAIWLACAAFGLFDLDLGADPIKSMLHSCGKTSLNFIMITLLVTPYRQLTGFTHVIRLRRMLGLFAFFYALLHFAVYFVLDQELDLRSLLADIGKRPYITIGFAALVMLVPLAITSTNGMMRRLGKRWQKLHRLIYVIAILGVWHYYWQVKRDVREPLIYVAILIVLLGYRYFKRRQVTSKSASSTAPEKV